MDDFDTFKAAREKEDPTARKMSDHQWAQAYAAYRNVRGRGGRSGASSGNTAQKRHRSKASRSGRSSARVNSRSDATHLCHQIRAQSAYADLRLIVNILAWVAIAAFIILALVSMSFHTSVPSAMVALLWGVVQVLGVVVARLLVQVLIDIPDIALDRALREATVERSAAADA